MIELLQKLITSLTALVALLSPPVLGAIADPPKDDMIIETTLAREKKLDLMDTSLQVSVGTGYIAEDNLTADNGLRGKSYTDNEYRQIKDEIVSRSYTGNIRPDEEFAMWIELLNTACAGKTITRELTQKDFNVLIETDCK